MLKLRTKTEFQIPAPRAVKTAIVRLIIDGIFLDKNNITPKGYYYYIDENGQIIKLDDLGSNAQKQWVIVEQVENNNLPALNNTQNLYANISQRLEEFVMLQLQQESGDNYGTNPSDWEIDTE